MYAQYVFYALLFLLSFAAGEGILNENVYIKQFAFGAAFVAMILISAVRPSNKTQPRQDNLSEQRIPKDLLPP
jgi:hypothetical protein